MENNLNTLVFVYGTLKSGGSIRGLDQFGYEHAAIINKATTLYPDYDLIDAGHFPAVVMNGTYKIAGEVWEISDEASEQLDAIEGYPDFYKRKQINTTAGKAWIYYLERDAWVGLHQDVESPHIEIINDEVKNWIL